MLSLTNAGGRVKVTLTGITSLEVKKNPRHKKNPDCGTKDTVYGPIILVDQEDAAAFEDDEEVRSRKVIMLLVSKAYYRLH